MLTGAADAAVTAPPNAFITGAVFGEAVRLDGSGESGQALALEGEILYAGSDRDLIVYDVSVPMRPRELGRVACPGEIRQVVVQNAMAYATGRAAGLMIVDATDPAHPRLRSRFDTCELATGVDVAGAVAFVGQRQNGVEFVDVSDPDRPVHIAMRKTGESQSVKYRNGYLYSGEWGPCKMTVFDCRDMRAIRRLAVIPLYGYGDGVWTKGDFVYAATGHHARNRDFATLTYKGIDTPELRKFGNLNAGSGCGHGLEIFDARDPSDPKRIGRVDFPPIYALNQDMWTPRTSGTGDVVFCCQTWNGVFAVDCSDKTAPKVLDRWVRPTAAAKGFPSAAISSIAVGDGCLYAAGDKCGLFAIPARGAAREACDRGTPPLHADYREPYPTDPQAFDVWKPATSGQARSVSVQGDLVYAACGQAGLHVLRIKPEGGFVRLGGLPDGRQVFDAQVAGNRLYTAEGGNGWAIYEMPTPTTFREVSRRTTFDGRCNLALQVWRPKPGLVVTSNRLRGVELLDESEFATGTPLAAALGPGWDRYLANGTLSDGRWLAFSVSNIRFKWFDLSTKPIRVLTTEKNRLRHMNGICRFSDELLFATYLDEYLFLKPGEVDPPDGSKWPTRKLPGRAIAGMPRASADGWVVVTSRGGREIGLWDFRDRENPKFVRHWKVSGNPDLVEFHGGRFIVPCGHQGVLISKRFDGSTTTDSR